jgi:dipeptidase E
MEAVRAFLGPVRRVVFVPFALRDVRGYAEKARGRFAREGIEVTPLPEGAAALDLLASADAVFVGGGNTFRLLARLERARLVEPLRRRALGGLPYLGASAGTNIAAPTIKTTNDMPITLPPSLDALGLVPFQINPHYFSGNTYVKNGEGFDEHFGETRDDRIREFHEMNDTPVIGLWEGACLRVAGGQVLLRGAGARVFRKGQQPVDVFPDTVLDRFLAAV